MFINHAHYTQLTTLERRILIRPSASVATSCICVRLHKYEKLADASADASDISGHSLPSTTVTQHKRNVHPNCD